jgi:hypothetical protein
MGVSDSFTVCKEVSRHAFEGHGETRKCSMAAQNKELPAIGRS